ncbi:hypothetical protein H0H92_004980 [Tricholoma furcatifolium]|nr:hypothetical protein H0H92_004980 [Tricholoma furcatifolium]
MSGLILAKRLKSHAASQTHKQAEKRQQRSSRPTYSAAPSSVRTPLLEMLDEIIQDPNAGLREWADARNDTEVLLPSLDWDQFDDSQLEAMMTSTTSLLSEMAEKARQYILDPEGLEQDSESEIDERSESDESSESEPEVEEPFYRHNPGRTKYKIPDDVHAPFYPWPNRETCVLDILRHIPRCAFSRKQNETIYWAASALGLKGDLPSDRVMRGIDASLQDICGIQSMRYQGAFGHPYYVNDLAAIIAQEMANPNIRPHLHFYPEDAGRILSEAWQASRWRTEVDPSLLTPMFRIHNQDFYVDEISLLQGHRACMPCRWFTRDGEMMGLAWRALPHSSGHGANESNYVSNNVPARKSQFGRLYPSHSPERMLCTHFSISIAFG